MTALLTSSQLLEDGTINPANGFLEALEQSLAPLGTWLMICSDPDHHERTERHAQVEFAALEASGYRCRSRAILDGRNPEEAGRLVAQADLIVLGGGHVPTQNRFVQRIGLRALLQDYPGLVLGISAGSMNSARTVYAQPELPGESTDPGYSRFLPGLGLTDVMILPHYQITREEMLDGKRLFEDITYPDSMGRCFYAIPDGSYISCGNGTVLHGEGWRIAQGQCRKVSAPGQCLSL